MSASIPTGGPAFPNDPTTYSEGRGMTLRDYFAAKAMHALITEPMWHEGGDTTVMHWSRGYQGDKGAGRFAFVAYRIADAMLDARSAK